MGISFNPCDEIPFGSTGLTNNNLTMTCHNGLLVAGARGTYGQSSGKYYFEIHLDSFNINNGTSSWGILGLSNTFTARFSDMMEGIVLQAGSISNPPFTTISAQLFVHNVLVIPDTLQLLLGNNRSICWALDLDNNKVWVRTNTNSWNANASADPSNNVGGIDISAVTKPMSPVALGSIFAPITGHFGDNGFNFLIPAGFTPGFPGAGGTPGVDIPRDLTLTGVTGTTASLTWNAPTGPAPSNYTLAYEEAGSGSWTNLTVSGTSDTITGLTPGANYVFRVNANYSGPVSCGYTDSVSGGTPTIKQSVNMADFWFSPTPGFIDLSNPANRRMFVDADGCTVRLGGNGQLPFGRPATVFFTRANSMANSFAQNRGLGGGFTLSGGDLTSYNVLPCGSSQLSPITSDFLSLSPDGGPTVWLRYSNDRGHTWGNPVARSLGPAGAYGVNLQWRQLGLARDRVYEVYWTGQEVTVLNGAFLDVDKAQT